MNYAPLKKPFKILLAACLLISAPSYADEEYYPPVQNENSEDTQARKVEDEDENDLQKYAQVNARGPSYAAMIAAIEEETQQPPQDPDAIIAANASLAPKAHNKGWDDEIDLPSNPYPGLFHYWVECPLDWSWFKLEDSSIWYIRYADRAKIGRWGSTHPLVLRLNNSWDSDKYFKYQLYNTVTLETIQVNLDRGPLLGGAYTRWIHFFFSNGYEIQLSDGSIWEVRSSDCSNMHGWTAGDCAYILINNDWLTGIFYPYILVDIATNRYVRLKWRS